jgi:hypothetical protein
MLWTQLFASGDHPVRNFAPHPFEEARTIPASFRRNLFQTDLLPLLQNPLTVILRCKLSLPDVQPDSFREIGRFSVQGFTDGKGPSAAKGKVPAAFYDSGFAKKSSLHPRQNLHFAYCISPQNFIQ